MKAGSGEVVFKFVASIGLKHCHGKVEEDSHDRMLSC